LSPTSVCTQTEDEDPIPSAPGNVRANAKVAPIFEYGAGRAGDGCVVVNPPVFLSEQDAMQVIREELKKSGVVLGDEKVILPEISFSRHYKEWTGNFFTTERAPRRIFPLRSLCLCGEPLV
jgi:hypothetical protein